MFQFPDDRLPRRLVLSCQCVECQCVELTPAQCACAYRVCCHTASSCASNAFNLRLKRTPLRCACARTTTAVTTNRSASTTSMHTSEPNTSLRCCPVVCLHLWVQVTHRALSLSTTTRLALSWRSIALHATRQYATCACCTAIPLGRTPLCLSRKLL